MRFFVGCVVLGTVGVAHGFVRSRTQESGAPISWTTNCVPFHVHEAGSEDLTLGQVIESAQASFDAWQTPDCADIQFFYQGLTNDDRVGYIQGSTNINEIVFREAPEDWPHQHGVIAVTTVTYCSAQAGECPYAGAILDADIELNGAEFTFSDTADVRRVRFDLRNTLTHEVGHFIGLDHTPIAEATMFASAPPGERSKATLHEDDVAGLCEIYPAGEDQRECAPFQVTGEYYIDLDNPPGAEGAGTDGCATTDGAPVWALAGLGLLLGVRRRRRR